jgi:hypothetical protein
VEDKDGRSDEDSSSVKVNDNDDFPDSLPCAQTYDTARGTYATGCEDGGEGGTGGGLPTIPPCKPNEVNNPNCEPAASTKPIKPDTEPEKIQNKPVTQNKKPQQEEPKEIHKSSKPTSNPPKEPTQKFKPPKTTSFKR